MFFGAYFGMNASAIMTTDDLGISDKIKGLSYTFVSSALSPYPLHEQPSGHDVNHTSGIYLQGSPSSSNLILFANESSTGFHDLNDIFTVFVPEYLFRFE